MANNRKIHLLTALFLCFLLAGCDIGNRSSRIPIADLVLDTTFHEFCDTFFITPNIKCMDCTDDFLYYTDYKQGLVMVDRKTYAITSVGTHGQGPGELLGPSQFYRAGNDSIYIMNEGKHSVDLFVKGIYTASYPFPASAVMTFNTRFFVDKETIYHTVIHKKHPVSRFGQDSCHYLAEHTAFDKPERGRHTTKHLVRRDSTFFLIGAVYPTLEEYSMDGMLMQQFDLSVIPEINQMMRQYREGSSDPRRYFTVIQDVCYEGGYLYLLTGMLTDGEYSCRLLVGIDVSSKDWYYRKKLRLAGKVYDTFCIGTDRLYAHDPSRSCIDVFSFD